MDTSGVAVLVQRVKRMTCDDCCFNRENGYCEASGIHSSEKKRKRYREKRYRDKNGCNELALLHFSYSGHYYRPGFMKLVEEENGEMWVYYDHDAEQRYDSSYHRTSWSTDHDRETGRGSKFGFQGSGGLKGSGQR